MPSKILYWLHTPFTRHVAVLVGGRGMILVITFLLMPVVARLFSPADFGVAAVFVAVCQLLSTVSALKYQMAVILPKSDSKAGQILALSKAVHIGFVLLLFAVLGGVEVIGESLPFCNTLGIWVWALPFVVGIIGAGNIRNAAITRSKEFTVSVRADIGQVLTMSLSRISLGILYGSSLWGLVSGYILGYLVQLGLLQGRTEKYHRVMSVKAGWWQLTRLAKEYSDFPLLNVPTALMVGMSPKLPLLLLGLWLGPAVVGFYAMAIRLITAPIGTVVNGLRRVYLQKAAELEGKGQSLSKAFMKVTVVLFVTGLVPFGVLWLYGEDILGFVLGETWREAGRYSEIMAPWFFLLWTSAAVSPTMVVRRKQGIFTVLQSIMFICRVAALGWCYILGASIEYTLTLFTWTNVSLLILILMFGMRYSSQKYQLVLNN